MTLIMERPQYLICMTSSTFGSNPKFREEFWEIVVSLQSLEGTTKLLTAKIAKESPKAAKNGRFIRLRAAWGRNTKMRRQYPTVDDQKPTTDD